MGGSNDPSNLVELTIEEHAEAHRILYEKYNRWQDKVAWMGLAKMIDKEEHIYMLLSEGKKGIPRSEEVKRKIKETKKINPNKLTDEHRHKISEANKNKILSIETKEKMRQAALGKKRPEFSQEWKDNLKAAKNKLPIVMCPHCGLTSRGPNMKRYHFDNCKGKV